MAPRSVERPMVTAMALSTSSSRLCSRGSRLASGTTGGPSLEASAGCGRRRPNHADTPPKRPTTPSAAENRHGGGRPLDAAVRPRGTMAQMPRLSTRVTAYRPYCWSRSRKRRAWPGGVSVRSCQPRAGSPVRVDQTRSSPSITAMSTRGEPATSGAMICSSRRPTSAMGTGPAGARSGSGGSTGATPRTYMWSSMLATTAPRLSDAGRRRSEKARREGARITGFRPASSTRTRSAIRSLRSASVAELPRSGDEVVDGYSRDSTA